MSEIVMASDVNYLKYINFTLQQLAAWPQLAEGLIVVAGVDEESPELQLLEKYRMP
jgi:hypothetical protein